MKPRRRAWRFADGGKGPLRQAADTGIPTHGNKIGVGQGGPLSSIKFTRAMVRPHHHGRTVVHDFGKGQVAHGTEPQADAKVNLSVGDPVQHWGGDKVLNSGFHSGKTGIETGNRSGDKGGRLNVSLISYENKYFPCLVEQVTEKAVEGLLGFRGVSSAGIYRLPHLAAINILIDNALVGGVNNSLCLYGHGKSLSFLLRSLSVKIPNNILPDAHHFQ